MLWQVSVPSIDSAIKPMMITGISWGLIYLAKSAWDQTVKSCNRVHMVADTMGAESGYQDSLLL